jgi:hypothetical protein
VHPLFFILVRCTPWQKGVLWGGRSGPHLRYWLLTWRSERARNKLRQHREIAASSHRPRPHIQPVRAGTLQLAPTAPAPSRSIQLQLQLQRLKGCYYRLMLLLFFASWLHGVRANGDTPPG